MKAPIVKVCGMRDEANIREIAKLNPDMMGFIFFPFSKRFVGHNFSSPALDNIEKVGVFVDELPENILATLKKYNLQTAQLHGSESPETCRTIQDAGFKIMKAFGIDENFNWEKLSLYTHVTQSFVFDTKTRQHGGSGEKFNWDVLSKYNLPHPFLLSGGIRPEDAPLLKQFCHPQCMGFDINSGFEVRPGEKNVALVNDFITTVKSR